MIKRLKRFLTTLSISTLMFVPMVPAVVHADIQGSLCKGADLTTADLGSSAECDDDGEATAKVDSIIKLVIDMFSLVVGVISVIMIIIGGLKYITSGGEAGNITGAKNTILYAIIGLVVVALAQVVVKFVLGKTTGSA